MINTQLTFFLELGIKYYTSGTLYLIVEYIHIYKKFSTSYFS